MWCSWITSADAILLLIESSTPLRAMQIPHILHINRTLESLLLEMKAVVLCAV